MISVLIITYNEERDLPRCLASVAWSDDIQVFDSYSDDATTAVASAAGAKVTQRRFDGYASQRNAALRGLAFRHPWLLILDADEVVPGPLREELRGFVQTAGPEVTGARLQRRDFLYDTWLKHAAITPFYLRLVRPERAHYEREINEVMHVEGAVRTLRQPFNHYPFSKGIAHWVNRHNRYSSMEARRAICERAEGMPFSLRGALGNSDPAVRRYHQKGLFYRAPGRVFLKWCYMMFWRRAFLDGRAGVTYACLQAGYEYLIVLKERELAQVPPGD